MVLIRCDVKSWHYIDAIAFFSVWHAATAMTSCYPGILMPSSILLCAAQNLPACVALIGICFLDATQFRENCFCGRFIFHDFAP